MENDYFTTLIYKELKGEISAEEKQQLASFVKESPENEQFYVETKLTWELSDGSIPLHLLDVEEDLKTVKAKLGVDEDAFSDNESTTTERSSLQKYFLQIFVVIMAFLGVICLFKKCSKQSHPQQLYAETSNLSFELPDGSIGTLKQGSKLSYSNTFSQYRIVNLEGTADFKVMPDSSHIFRVYANEAVVGVLGTEFRVDCNKEQTLVAVTSGKVSFSQNGKSIFLGRGQVAVAKVGGTPEKESIDASKLKLWQKKRFRFENETLESITELLEFIYQVDITIVNTEMKNCRISGLINSDEPQKILSYIANSKNMTLTSLSENRFQLEQGTCE